MITVPELRARKLITDLGISDTAKIAIEDLIIYFDGHIRQIAMTNCDGRVVMKNGKSIVTLNANIEFAPKKRFVLSHELGHMLLHASKDATFSDDYYTLEAYKHGIQEREANDFAAALLMPADAFKQACFRQKFGMGLIRMLAEKFNTSLASTVYRYIELGPHPICAFYSKDGIVQYWKRSENFWHKVVDRNRLRVPSDSVAEEYYAKGRIYQGSDSDQPIYKSTWCELKEEENDKQMFEFCIVTRTYATVLSVIWEK
ncbi:MAG TPA: ImmA/IrrE family metallo-endopeptidase [Puia sp.]|nr:ImmA/IrrE family metallo-endopeptidase [Puia sp.]